MTESNVAIVGYSGFIGRHLTERLAQEKNINLHLFGRSDSDSLNNLPIHKIDFSNPEKIAADFDKIDLVYYLISETIPATSWEQPLTEIHKNLIPFITFLESISKSNVKKVVFLSSAGTIYGPSLEKINETSNKKPFSPYGITKLSMEYFLNYFETKYGIKHDIYRISNVYGEGQDTSKGLGLINTFLEKITTDQKITVFGDGENIRNYIYIKDVVELLSLSLNLNLSTSQIYNLSSNDTLKINEVIAILKNAIEEPFEINYIPNRQSDNSFIDLDNSLIKLAKKDFIFTNIEDGIKKTYKHIHSTLIKSKI
jgi:UDP-glucose 4-epimerase